MQRRLETLRDAAERPLDLVLGPDTQPDSDAILASAAHRTAQSYYLNRLDLGGGEAGGAAVSSVTVLLNVCGRDVGVSQQVP
jgi:hypothetical protein